MAVVPIAVADNALHVATNSSDELAGEIATRREHDSATLAGRASDPSDRIARTAVDAPCMREQYTGVTPAI